MLQPVRSKYRKAHKGRIHGHASRCNLMNYGAFGLKAIEPNRVIGKQIEAARVALTTSGGSVSNNVITYTATIPADTPDVTAPATAAITEAGIFNANSAGTMLARTVFTAINKGELDTMTISWDITIS